MNKEIEITLLEIACTVLAGHTPTMCACRDEILEELDITDDDADILQQLIEAYMDKEEYHSEQVGGDTLRAHFKCCHAPKDMGHMFGCPNSLENL